MSDESAADTVAGGGTGAADDSGALRIAFAVGVTVTKWTRLWEQRHPHIALQVFRSEPGEQTAVLHAAVPAVPAADVSFVRHPVDREGLSLISLYSEVPVVGVARDHPASVFDEIAVADLADEHLLQQPDEVPEWRDVATEIADGSRRALRGIHSLDDAVEQVAAGVGIVILPKSVARLHSRKDVVYVPVTGVAETPVSLAWRAGDESPLVEEFIGIVRGRSAASSRAGGLEKGAGSRSGSGARGGAALGGESGGDGARPPKKIGPVAKAKAKARAAREADGAGSAASGQRRAGSQPRKKAQSEQVNKAQARRRKFGGSR